MPAYKQTANVLQKLEDYHEAKIFLNSALLIQPDNIDLIMQLGNIARNEGNQWEALEQFKTVIIKNPSHVLAYIYAAEVLRELECFEEAPFGSPQAVQAANAAANPRLSQAMNNAAAYQDCAAWDVPPAAAFENKPVVSDIPTLILSGEHDPITPPAWGELTAEGLSKSQHLVFPGTGHGVLGRHNCSNQVVEEFLAAPDEPVDASCMDEVPVLFGGN